MIFLTVWHLSVSVFTIGCVPLLGKCLRKKIAAVILCLGMKLKCISFISNCYLINLHISILIISRTWYANFSPSPRKLPQPMEIVLNSNTTGILLLLRSGFQHCRHTPTTIWFTGLLFIPDAYAANFLISDIYHRLILPFPDSIQSAHSSWLDVHSMYTNDCIFQKNYSCTTKTPYSKTSCDTFFKLFSYLHNLMLTYHHHSLCTVHHIISWLVLTTVFTIPKNSNFWSPVRLTPTNRFLSASYLAW